MNLAHQTRPSNKYILNQRPIDKNTILLRSLLQRNREFFNTGKTNDIRFRITQLKKLRESILANKDEMLKALWEDLKKPGFEAYIGEIGIVLNEIEHALANIRQWTKGRRTGTPAIYSPARSLILPEPYGMVLIIGPWNYPFQLTLAPLVGAIAAGNTAIIKPSELAPRSAEVLARIVASAFDNEYVSVTIGGIEISQELINERFDYIFFTGGPEIGKIVMQAASRNLTPITLELGGKNPAIVDNEISLKAVAKKITWGKFLNAGQSCLAPDYLLVHQEAKDELLQRIKENIHEFYGENPKLSRDYARIVNEHHFHRIARLLRSGRKITGGRIDLSQLYIEPTVIDEVTITQPLMKEEIFGPILPVMSYKNLNEAVSVVKSLPKPLAVYIFSNNGKKREFIIRNTSSGGVGVNDVLIHIGNYYLPFGGVGNSGMGAYHGKSSFDTFSHLKSVMMSSRLKDFRLIYPPYGKRKMNLLSRISR